MKKMVSVLAAGAAAVALAVGAAAPAYAQFGNGNANCSTTWSYTRVNSNLSIEHYHEAAGWWRAVDKPAGISTYKGWWQPGPVYMELESAGGFSGAVYGCSA